MLAARITALVACFAILVAGWTLAIPGSIVVPAVAYLLLVVFVAPVVAPRVVSPSGETRRMAWPVRVVITVIFALGIGVRLWLSGRPG